MSDQFALLQQMDGVEYRLAEPADLSFLREFGRVFRVFDDNDSGNISFGVDDGHRKMFIKLAGALTVNACNSPDKAVAILRRAEAVNRDIAHANIVRYIGAIEYFPYFGLMFDWSEGELLRRTNEQAFARFRTLPLTERLAAFDTVIDAIQHVHDSGYVAVDVYDASFLYNFDSKRITICDIDVFEKKPMVNTMGRMWGSSRFMSPEESELGTVIDEITNVYTLGAVAFLFFGDERVRTLATWDAGCRQFDVAHRATSDDRSVRYQSIAAFATAWRQS